MAKELSTEEKMAVILEGLRHEKGVFLKSAENTVFHKLSITNGETYLAILCRKDFGTILLKVLGN